MRMRSLSLLLLSVLCCFPFASAFADKGYQLKHRPGDFFETAQAACDSAIPDAQAQPMAQTPPVTILSATPVSSATCVFKVKRISDGSVFSNQGYDCSSASGCELLTFSCDVDAPDSLTWPRHHADAQDNIIPGTVVPIFADPVCLNGCKANNAKAVDDCFYDGNNVLFCIFPLKRTGAVCSVKTVAPEVSSECPAGYEVVGGKCKLLPPEDPCVANPTAPGCPPPVDPCVAEPTGAGCPGGGDTGGGDTGGTDPGTGTGPGTGTEPAPGSAGGLACGDTFACSGDSIACATAQLEKIQMCQDQRGNDYNGAGKAAIGEALQDPDGDLEESEVHLTSIISGHARFLPTSCPPAQSFTVFGRQFAFKNDLFCNFATSMSWLVVAMASLTAALYIGQSFGSS